MPEEKFTRCPSCRTVFRVTQAQLEMRDGQVRCGHCHTVFDGVSHLVSLAPPDEDDFAFDPDAAGPPTVTLRSARALGLPPAGDDVGPQSGQVADDGSITATGTPAAAGSARLEGTRTSANEASASAAGQWAAGLPPAGASAASGSATSVPAPGRPAADDAATNDASTADIPRRGDDAPPRRRKAGVAWGIAAALLLLVLVGQAVFHFRDAIAARWPSTAPLLNSACVTLGCTVGPPHEINELAIQASDLQADPAHRGLLILTATVRNRSTRMLAYPHLELTLTDAQDQVVVRRAFAPPEYLGGTADLAAGIPANAEITVKLFVDASATTQAGYRLYLFYV